MKNKIAISTVICTSVAGVTGSYSSNIYLNALNDSHVKLNYQTVEKEGILKKLLKDGNHEDIDKPYKDFYHNKKDIEADYKVDQLKSKEKNRFSYSMCCKSLYLIPKIIKYYTFASVSGLILVALTDALTNKVVGIKPVETVFSWFKGGKWSFYMLLKRDNKQIRYVKRQIDNIIE